MADYRIPEELPRMVAERRVIPFVGAGFSASHGLPGWGDLLETVAEDLRIQDFDPPLSFEEISEYANKDFLRVAEYLYIKSGTAIGPLRLALTKALQHTYSLDDSSPQIELVNLGAPQVYTTNFDDLLERTYRTLEHPVEVVALSRDIAVARPTETQVVKYHGDLRYDPTLVLTESNYYKRLDFESPMDLKFRSDLIGRSVLFMGYSFTDINIRVIWFKLMEMMRDVPLADRPTSYIVRFDPNPVQEALFGAVGLRTINLDPDGVAQDTSERTELLSQFLSDVGAAGSSDGLIPGQSQLRFASKSLLDRLTSQLERIEEGRLFIVPPEMRELARRQVPDAFRERVREVIRMVTRPDVRPVFWGVQLGSTVAWAQREVPELATALAVKALMQSGDRSFLSQEPIDWGRLWSQSLDTGIAQVVIKWTDEELRSHERNTFIDTDLAYGLDLTRRLEQGLIRIEGPFEPDPAPSAIIARASELYPSVANYTPSRTSPPDPQSLVDEIEQRSSSESDDDDGTSEPS